VAAPWALELYERCHTYHTLPGAGGAYDQDEYLMAAMEQAAGVSALFDIGGKKLAENRKWQELHARLQEESAAVIAYVNAHDDKNA
jgi:hypothetical protein